jgi:hypothetical protein
VPDGQHPRMRRTLQAARTTSWVPVRRWPSSSRSSSWEFGWNRPWTATSPGSCGWDRVRGPSGDTVEPPRLQRRRLRRPVLLADGRRSHQPPRRRAPRHEDRQPFRFGRIGYPALAWALSGGGRLWLLPWVLVGINVRVCRSARRDRCRLRARRRPFAVVRADPGKRPRLRVHAGTGSV